VLYLIGPRSREMLGNALEATFAGILMSDGYTVYRDRPNRLRCWAHLTPQVRGLAESTDRRAARLGTEMAGILKRLQAAVYAARTASPPQPLSQCHAADIARLRRLCERHRDDTHSVAGSLAREFLNDWVLPAVQIRHYTATTYRGTSTTRGPSQPPCR
jgi:hypothetical protein